MAHTRNRSQGKRNAAPKLTFERLEPRQLLAADFQITEFLASNDSGIVDDNGEPSDWIEIFNAGTSTGNLNGFTLTDDPNEPDKYTLPARNVAAGQYLVVFANTDAAPATGSALYTGFKLSAGGEYVALFDPAGNLLSEFGDNGTDYPAQSQDISYGVQFSGANISTPREVGYFNTPTPGQANGALSAGTTAQVQVSTPAGFYDNAFQVTLSTETSGATIRYTTNGSTPSATNGFFYNNPITINKTTIIRAVATKTNFNTSPSETYSYIFVDDVLTQSNNGQTPPNFPASWGNKPVDYGIDPDVIATEGANAVKDALLAIPTWSITTDIENLFDVNTGIYTNAIEDGRDWERPASVELLNPDGSDGFQVNAGLRIRGGFSRLASNPKHSFRLFFRSEYGDSKLDFPVHGDTGTDSFDKIDLRTAQNYSWSKEGNAENNFIIDQFSRENQLALGQPSTRSSWLHLYLNGQYWGLYQTQERAEARFAAEYFGGDVEDYDVIKPDAGPGRPYTNAATDGNLNAFTALFQQANARATDGTTPAFINNAAYYRVQGLNPDGSPNANFQTLLDVDNLIDYMTLILHSGNFDAPISQFLSDRSVNNFVAIFDRTGNEGFKFFIHDSEHSYKSLNENRNGPYNHSNFESGVSRFNPQWLHQQLMANAEYRIAFADRIQEVFFNNGPLTTENLLARWDLLASQIDQAIIGESARWGDAQRSSPRLKSDWEATVADVRDNIIAQRNPVFFDQLRATVLQLKSSAGSGNYDRTVAAPLLPGIDAPNFLIEGVAQHGGQINSGDELRFTGNGGTIYYTTDGSDPREVGGSINAASQTYIPTTSTSTLFGTGSTWKYRDNGQNLGTSWRNTNFNDNAWASGAAELGYGDGGEGTTVSFGNDANDKLITTYFRKQFNATGNYQSATLRVQRDDGIVVYINGTEVVRDNLPNGLITFDTPASGVVGGAGETEFNEFNIPANLLVSGTNTIAVEVHQVSATSSDLSFDAELIVGQQSANPVTLSDTTPILSRVRSSNGTWSALTSAVFVVADEVASASNLRISEINYNPANGGAEFIELQNINTAGGATVDLSGVTLTNGPSVPLTLAAGTTLAAGQYGLLVGDVSAFTAAYPSVDPALILGVYEGGLSNSGEGITLVAADGSVIVDFDYDDSDPFPIAADGTGATLELISPATISAQQLNKYYSWQSSHAIGGTPGAAAAAVPNIVINEVFAHSDAPNVDFIELRNNSWSSIDVGGWFLSDSGDDLNKFQIPIGTVISAGDYLVLDEIDFNPVGGANRFALSSTGDEVWLTAGTGSTTKFIDAIAVGATFNSVSVGRSIDGTGRLLPLASRTPGTANTAPTVSPIIISEVNYHPEAPSASALAIEPGLTEGDLEFIELTNTLSIPLSLSDWRLRGESDFDFSTETLSANASIVMVSFDPSDPINTNRTSAFRNHYGISNAVTLIGGTSGALSNSFGKVALQRADAANADGSIPFVWVDEVLYDDLAPWPAADGTGPSLNRIAANANGTHSGSWNGAAPTPGSSNLQTYAPEVLASVRDNGAIVRPDILDTISFVFDADVIVNKGHLQLLDQTLGTNVNVNSGSVGFNYDPMTLTATWDVSALNLREAFFQATLSQSVRASGSNIALDGDGNQTAGGNHLQQIYVAIPGDANLDGDVDISQFNILTQVNTGDIAIVLSNLGRTGRVNWSTGDFNGDGDVDISSVNILTQTDSGDYAVTLANLGKDASNFSQPATVLPLPTIVSKPIVSQAVNSQTVNSQPVGLKPVVTQPVVARSSAAAVNFSQVSSTEPAQPVSPIPMLANAKVSSVVSSAFNIAEPVFRPLLSDAALTTTGNTDDARKMSFATDVYSALSSDNNFQPTSLGLAGAQEQIDDLFADTDDFTDIDAVDELDEGMIGDFFES